MKKNFDLKVNESANAVRDLLPYFSLAIQKWDSLGMSFNNWLYFQIIRTLFEYHSKGIIESKKMLFKQLLSVRFKIASNQFHGMNFSSLLHLTQSKLLLINYLLNIKRDIL